MKKRRRRQRASRAVSASPLPEDVSDEDEAAAEALSTLQSGILLQQPAPPKLPNDPTLVVEEKDGLPVIVGDDGAFTMFDRAPRRRRAAALGQASSSSLPARRGGSAGPPARTPAATSTASGPAPLPPSPAGGIFERPVNTFFFPEHGLLSFPPKGA